MKTETAEEFLKRGGKIHVCAENESAFTMKTFRESFHMKKAISGYWKQRKAEQRWWEMRMKNAEQSL